MKHGSKTKKKEPNEKKSISVRNQYSMEEIHKMLGDIDAAVSTHKAKQQGVNPENMVKTIRGGRVVWITVEEMNEILSKQRKLSGKKYQKRTVRGEDSLTSEINRRVEACRSLIHTIRKVSPEESGAFTALLRNLECIQNMSVSHAREYRILENAIQRKKQQDPILQEMEDATSNMVDSLNKDNLSNVDLCQSFCDRHMDEYLAKQKRLEPYIRKAKEYRREFLLSKQQLFQFQFNLLDQGEQTLTQHLEEILYHDQEGEVSENLVQCSKEIRSLLNKGKLYFEKFEHYPPDELLENKDLFKEADQTYLTPLFNKIVGYVDLFRTAWTEFVESKDKESAQSEQSSEISSSHRMVYQEKQDNG